MAKAGDDGTHWDDLLLTGSLSETDGDHWHQSSAMASQALTAADPLQDSNLLLGHE